MTVLLRSLVVWLMLLAIPCQGYASATMMLCAAPAKAAGASMSEHAALTGTAMPAGVHDHAAMLAAMAVAGNDSVHAGHRHGGDGKLNHHGMKCGGASACCVAVAAPFHHTMDVPALSFASLAIPFYPDFLPAVDLAHPERPPQGTRV